MFCEIEFKSVNFKGVNGFYTDERVVRNSVPTDLYMYELRYDDDNKGYADELAKTIMVNFLGTLILEKDIGIGDSEIIEVSEKDFIC